MKRGLSHTLALIGLGLATFAVTPGYAQTTAPGPYYATPSWDQQLPAATRFIVLSNWNSEAVLDRETGLVWQRALSADRLIFSSASSRCLNMTTGNRAGWRLPTVNELASLFDPSAPPLPAGHPFTGIPPAGSIGTRFWSATPDVNNSDFRRTVGYEFSLQLGRIVLVLGAASNTTSGATDHFWCVRGGLQNDPQ